MKAPDLSMCGLPKLRGFEVCERHALRIANKVLLDDQLISELADESAVHQFRTDRQRFLDHMRQEDERKRAAFRARRRGDQQDAHVVYYVRLSE